MKKLLGILFLAIIFAVTSGNLFARDSNAFKNTLLKVELNQTGDNTYDVALYTQKIYNEPVKVIKKSDNYYYLLLPETGHSITSISPVGDIKNVSIKSYPYAGQDVENGYTKIGISTTKEIRLTTSLRTLDPSVSPRMDPIRLARLDRAFERYSQRLADNNIPTPLAQFRKQEVQQPIEAQGQIAVKSPEDLIATTEGKKVTAPVKKTVKPVKAQTVAVKKAETKKPVKVAQKPVSIAQKPVQVIQPKTSEQSTVVDVKKALEKPVVKKQPAKTAQVSQPVKVAQSVPAVQKTVQKPQQAVQTAQPKEKTKPVVEQQKAAQSVPAVSPVDVKVKPQAVETEKEIETKKPVPAPVVGKTEAVKDTASVETKTVEPEKQPEKTAPVASQPVKVQVPVSVPVQPQKQQDNNLIVLGAVFACLLASYILTKVRHARKLAHEAIQQRMAAQVNGDIKELLSKKSGQQSEKQTDEIFEQVQEVVEPVPENENVVSDIQTADTEADNTSAIQDEIQMQAVANQEAAIYEEGTPEAFSTYEDEPEIVVSEVEAESVPVEKEPLRPEIAAMIDKMAVATQTIAYNDDEADEALKDLYTPIEDAEGYAVYNEANYNPVVETAAATQPIHNDDVATIVATSKLTETRGLYLAKFEGSTSLVGYIQDDVYVLYNFGDEELMDAELESKLAKESETDSLYIVSTGGKKLMVKSTPYDMSLEMVM